MTTRIKKPVKKPDFSDLHRPSRFLFHWKLDLRKFTWQTQNANYFV